MVLALRRLGFEQIDELERAPRASLRLRFGALVEQRLDQLLGRMAEPFDPVEPPDLIRVEQAFVEPIGAPETLGRYIDQLAGNLCTVLQHRALGARRLDLLFHRVDDTLQIVRIGTAMSSQDARHLARLLTGRLETVDPGFGVERMSLAASMVEPIRLQQVDTFSGDSGTEIARLLDTLANRFGSGQLYRLVPVESDLPERAVGRVPALAPAQGTSWPDDLPRPSRLFARPEPIETLALLPDHPPLHFTWRGVRRRITRSDGPERVFGEWWRMEEERHLVRDYFQVEDNDGERFWLFRAGDGENPATGTMRWYLHGVFA
jgi:protein ImuB